MRKYQLIYWKTSKKSPQYLAKNPIGLVPSIATEDGTLLHQSLAIIEYMELAYPDTYHLFPAHLMDLIYVKSVSYDIAIDMHPLNNLRVLKYLTANLAVSEEDKTKWYHHWIHTGFSAVETYLSSRQKYGDFCLGDKPTLADVCLVPQVFNAKRFKCDMSAYPIINQINENCCKLDSFKHAAPELT